MKIDQQMEGKEYNTLFSYKASSTFKEDSMSFHCEPCSGKPPHLQTDPFVKARSIFPHELASYIALYKGYIVVVLWSKEV
jgi:hypothetical protein